MTAARTRTAGRWLATVVVCIAAASCSSATKTATPPAPHLSPDDICGFLPKDLVVTALGTSDLTVSSVSRSWPFFTCRVARGSTPGVALEVNTDVSGGSEAGFTLYQIAQAKQAGTPGWIYFPATDPTGYSAPQELTAATGDPAAVGALVNYAYGNYHLKISLDRGAPGRQATADAAALAQALAVKLAYPSQHSPYASYSPPAAASTTTS